MKRNAFTLAEVLITVVIIGVIAAITIPAIVENTNAQEYRTALKKALSELNQAMELHYAMQNLTATDYSSGQDLVDGLFKKRLNVIYGEDTFTDGGGDEYCENGAVFTTDDGLIYCITKGFSSTGSGESNDICNINNTTPCGSEPNIYIDVNGVKGPNKLTLSSKHPKDIYEATIYSQRVLPYGVPTQEVLYEKSGLNNNSQNSDQSSGNEPGSSGSTSGGSGEDSGGSTGGDNNNPGENPNPPKPDPEVNPNPDPQNPEQPEIPEYDPHRWPTWQDFLNWLRDILGIIFG